MISIKKLVAAFSMLATTVSAQNGQATLESSGGLKLTLMATIDGDPGIPTLNGKFDFADESTKKWVSNG